MSKKNSILALQAQVMLVRNGKGLKCLLIAAIIALVYSPAFVMLVPLWLYSVLEERIGVAKINPP
ncbi:hypothetical protein GGQ85_003882 [Nitrobacter vulgaris]|uniref:hypothetical protein n=1 Tax=Nitrobacter TaxID=911 RepID=UPI0013EF7129|nr:MULTISPECIES: hypothetical protein [Nitrobacter]MDR6306154.1 hypothetical protein [Nitrobacter vulgaris]